MTFPLKNGGKRAVSTQTWKEVSNSAAYALTFEKNPPVKIPGTETQVPVVVTRYSSPASNQKYPFALFDNRAVDIVAMEATNGYQWPELQVAPFEPPSGWDQGTAVWTHLLLKFQSPKCVDYNSECINWECVDELECVDVKSIHRIAKANPYLSQMLYEKDDHSGFVLLNKAQRDSEILHPTGLIQVVDVPANRMHGGAAT